MREDQYCGDSKRCQACAPSPCVYSPKSQSSIISHVLGAEAALQPTGAVYPLAEADYYSRNGLKNMNVVEECEEKHEAKL